MALRGGTTGQLFEENWLKEVQAVLLKMMINGGEMGLSTCGVCARVWQAACSKGVVDL
jgi:hypothetical protein